ncbi:hypothetical protein [Mesorhizobium neociceri]|uniref:Uncharacterized protein n=1 Tax=Mesorhizobium neociceri TaxID=1307853 RepID=A0A838BFY5_9HYPH|nr:hypothetical protein [Mesorhizobium neociceri]MBA1144791.1 hypothetical protein [Mesorhizobium neociceri]
MALVDETMLAWLDGLESYMKEDGVYELRVLVDKRGQKYTTHRVETQLQDDMFVEDDVIVRVDADGQRRPISLG